MKKLIFLLILVTILFFSSSQTYEQQSLIPLFEDFLVAKPLEAPLQKLEIPYWGRTISVEERGYYHFVEFVIRKSAHFFLFGLVALVFYGVLPKVRYRFLLAMLSTLVLAIADEFHQQLTGGRTPSWQDVFLDMSGALTFLCVFICVKCMRQKIR
ncbi:VanZ family protein [Psychrobacillus sp. INOP01]|uniref:VanZ family protein n=1 Tax=Psychrobacillus sp. INOP01 TaxID=2829187 RepID=UPI001BABF46D|nr:VanZ family protein [Psychrobacillus sp. INOP01]QUG40581.1 VanZ family protein [Psychrobacillus sp. INOP01]